MTHAGIESRETKSPTRKVDLPARPSSQNVEHVKFNTGFVARWLTAIIITIVVVGAIANYAVYNLAPHPDHPVADVLKRFDLGHEPSIPAFYSATMMLCSAVLLCFLGRFDRGAEGSRKRYWYALAILFVALAIDEAVMFHEMATAAMDRMNVSGPFYFSWIIPGAIFAAVVGLAFMRFVWSLDRRTRNLLMLSGIVFVSGAIGMESIAGVIFAAAENEEAAIRSVSHVIVQAFEEGMEMAGVAIFFCALLVYANRCGLGIDVRYDPPEPMVTSE